MHPVITFDHVSKRYRTRGTGGLREGLAGLARHCLRGTAHGGAESEVFWAVRDLTFEVPRGRTLGLIGPNGAGKTTTLKLLSHIASPTTGSIKVSGRVCALIELGAGFHPELTGRENVFLNGTILGMRRHEITDRFEEIVEFAELTRFIDTPVKYYSSGMYARLGFAVAAHTNPDVLVVDEVLAVGDYGFQQRCYARMKALQNNGTTVLLVSHNLAAITDACDEVIVLNRGQAVFQGPTAQAVAQYAELIRQTSVQREALAVGRDGIAERVLTHGARIFEVRLVDDAGEAVRVAAPGQRLTVIAEIEFLEDAPHPVFACFVRDERGQLIYDQTTRYQATFTPSFHRGERTVVKYELQMNVVNGIYNVGLDLAYADLSCYYDRLESALPIVVHGGDGGKGVADFACRFRFEEPRAAVGRHSGQVANARLPVS